MEIWLPDLPDIQLVQNYHRIPMNTTRWKNWPTADNPYINGASWHLTFNHRAMERAAGTGLRTRAAPRSETQCKYRHRRRFGVFLLIVWLAATLNFFLPKLSGQDPVRTKLLAEASLGGYVHAGIEDMVKVYQEKFGLDKPLWRQYLNYRGRRFARRPQLLHLQLSAHRRQHDRRGDAMDDRACSASPRCSLSPPAPARRPARVARGAALDALAHAAALGAARHSLLPARAGADVSVRLPVPVCCRSSAATAPAPTPA